MSHAGNARRPRRVIVSGGIGSGKTTVLGVLERLGAVVIEADEIGHRILARDGPAFARVTQRWPEVVVDGRIDRGRLAAIVFNDDEELRALEAITHPLIATEIAQRVRAAKDRDVALELPVAGEFNSAGWTRIVVMAPEEVRLLRTIERGMKPEDVVDRIAAQRDQRDWLDAADILIENTGSLAELEARVVAVWDHLATDS